MQQRGTGEVGEADQWDIIGGATVVLLDVVHLFARGDHTQTRVPGRQSLEQRFDAGVLDLAFHGAGWMLQWFETIQHQEAARLAHQAREACTAIPGRAQRRIGITEGPQRLGHEGVRRCGTLLARALAVERPVEDTLGTAPVLERQLGHPGGDERGLAHSTKGPHDDYVLLRIVPRGIEPAQVFVAANEPLGRVPQLGRGDVNGRFQAGKDLDQVPEHSGAEPFLVEKQPAIMPQRADAPVVLLLRLCFTRAEGEPRITGDVESVEIEIRGPVNKEWAPVIDRQIRFPLGVGELRLWLAEVLRERRQARAQIGILGEQRGHRGLFRHASGGLADQVNDGIAMPDVGVELLQCLPTRDHEILLHGDIEVGALEIRGQEVAVGNKLAADRGQKQFLIAYHPGPRFSTAASASANSSFRRP